MSQYKKLDQLIYKLKFYKSKRDYNKQVRKLIENNPIDESKFTKDILKAHKNKWGCFDKYLNLDYFKLYSTINNKIDINYVPDYIYRFPIEKILLDRRYSVCMADKNIAEIMYFGKFQELFPEVLIRKIKGVFYDADYNHISNIKDFLQNIEQPEIVVKECIETGAGKGVYFFKKNSKDGMFYRNKKQGLITFLSKDENFVVQKMITQSNKMNLFNPTSINTIRVVTYRSVKDEKVHILQMLIKRGGDSLKVDNLNSGGSFIKINPKNGKIAKFGIDKEGNKIYHNVDLNKIEEYKEIKELATAVAEKDYFHRQLFFDIFLDKNNSPKIMEINYSAHPPIQAVCGPAFGEFTDEVIEYCKNHKGFISMSAEFSFSP